MGRSLVLLVATLTASFIAMGAEQKPGVPGKMTISQIMLKAHQPERAARKALDQRVIDGKATEAEKKELLRLYEALAQSVPKKGDLDDWKKQTMPLVEAARSVVKGEEKATSRLAAALDCKGCHVKHRKGS